MKLLSCLATGCLLLAAAVAPLADYNKHKGASLASVTPNEMLCCGSKCGTIAPIELDTAKTLCNGVTHCWGFSYDPDAKLAKFGSGVAASGTDSYVTPSGFSGAVDGYRSFHYSTRGAFFDITLTHTYQIPSSLCAAQCDDEDNCNVFEMTGDNCKLYYWKVAPEGTTLYMRSGNLEMLNSTNATACPPSEP